MTPELLDACLQSGEYVDSASPVIAAFAARVCGDASDDVTRAVRLYYAVRDDIVYTPYCDFRARDTFRASACLVRGSGFCVAKAALLAAAARALGIPARVGFADVRNHLTTPKLRRFMGTDTFYHHGYTELFLEGKWVKAQNISRQYKTTALEVTMTARTEIKSDQQAERLVTLASVVRPRFISGGAFGSSPGGGGTSSPGFPGEDSPRGNGGDGNGGNGNGDGFGGAGNGGGNSGASGADGRGANGFGRGNGGSGSIGDAGYKHETRYIGKQPKLGERLNDK